MSVPVRLNLAAKEFNISIDRVISFLESKGYSIENKPTTKLLEEQYIALQEEFMGDKTKKIKIDKITETTKEEQEAIKKEYAEKHGKIETVSPSLKGPKIVGKIEPVVKKTEVEIKEVEKKKEKVEEAPKVEEIKTEKATEEKPDSKEESTGKSPKTKAPEETPDNNRIVTKYAVLSGVKSTGNIDISKFEKKPTPKKEEESDAAKKKRKRIVSSPTNNQQPHQKNNNSHKKNKSKGAKTEKIEASEEEIQKQIKETLERLTSGSKSKGAKHRKAKRELRREESIEENEQIDKESKTIQVSEYITPNELSSLMDINVNEIISTCMSIDLMVSINQKLDSETIKLLAEEFGFEVEFISAEEEDNWEEEIYQDIAEEERPPVVTIMGHVDHGKTSLLDYIRKTNIVSKESGGITQGIGAYSVNFDSGKKITFLDTPGHEAFTAMRARGTKITDIVIIVIAADDKVMPMTKEAISHAEAAGVPIIFAITKIDKPNSAPEKLKEQLAGINYLVEDWGGKIQSQEISSKSGKGINDLLEKILLEAEVLELKSPYSAPASGTVIEATLEKGRGYISTLLVEKGTLSKGDFVLAGSCVGKVKAMFDEIGKETKKATPSIPVLTLGLDGAPQAGDKFRVFENEKDAKQLATRRQQIIREQNVRTKKHITLEEIGRRLKVGEFKEINLIIRADMDGSIEALSGSLQRLSTQEVGVNIIHKGLGQITESDVLLASASNAIIIGFQVRPSTAAKKLAETEDIEIRLYSVIYQAIEEIKESMEGMLSVKFVEEIVGNVEVRDIFKISKLGTIAGCYVTTGKITSKSSIRIIREGVVIHTGTLSSLKRFKDDVKEVTKEYECGLSIENYNQIEVGDTIEVFEQREVQQKL